MKKLSTFAIFFLPILSFGQTESGPDIVWQKCINLLKEGRLDSSTVRISFLKNSFQRIDSIKQFFIQLDTVVYNDGYYSVGQSILDPFMEFNGQQVGEWKYFYPTGKIYSKGLFSIGAYTECQAGGPMTNGYSFKTGQWNYWHENGTVMANGIYKPITTIIKNSCGTDTLFLSKATAEWKYFNGDGKTETNSEETSQKINNGH
jgi:antitoxin component YwqK of YwqJK toxin-antitoxin module